MKKLLFTLATVLLLCTNSIYGALSDADNGFLNWSDSYIKSNSTGDTALDQKISNSVSQKVTADLENDTFSYEKYKQYVSDAYDEAYQKSGMLDNDSISQAKSKAVGGFVCACAGELNSAFNDFNSHLYDQNIVPLASQVSQLSAKVQSNTKALNAQIPTINVKIELLKQKVLETQQMLYDLKEREIQLR